MTLLATNYNPNLVNLMVNSIPIKGIVDSIKTTTKEDKNSIVTSIDGTHSVFITNNDDQGTISFTLFDDSPNISYLEGLLLLNQIIPVSILDLNSGGIKDFPQCKLQKRPDTDVGKEQGKREFMFIHTGQR